MNVWGVNLIYIRHVVLIMWPIGINRVASLLFSVHKSSPVALWDSKVFIICTLQNLTGRSWSSGTFLLTLLWSLWIWT